LAVNFTMNTRLYPGIMPYQAGNQVAEYVKQNNIDPDQLYFYNSFSFSLGFYLEHTIKLGNAKVFAPQLKNGDSLFVVTTREYIPELDKKYRVEEVQTFGTFKVTRLSARVLFPEERVNNLEKYYLMRITGLK
ncbi:MAG: hypothetical protein ACPF9D_06640, partial [Owenweeksia sp.]